MKTINIFGQNITIKKSKGLIHTHQTMAYFDSTTNEIVIDSSLKGEQYNQTLFHEIGHALFYRLGWSQSISGQLEESIVESYSKMIFELFTVKKKR